MKIDRVTITGADNKTATTDLIQLTKEFPFVEWGILFSKNREGEQRYPSRQKIMEFASYDLPLSAHFCGWHSRQVMENFNFTLLKELPKAFLRIQINYNFHKSGDWQVKPVIDWAMNNPDRAIIFQSNQSNGAALELIRANMRSENIHFLYDSSGGRGTEVKEILPTYENYTGYSGGISPQNIEYVCRKIDKHKLKDKVWIDMESGVRTDNELDIDKVKDVLAIVDNYVLKGTFEA